MTNNKKNHNHQCLADSLAQESLSEAAEHFFGRRLDIEQGLQDYQQKVKELQETHQSVLNSMANLHFLLRRGNPQTVHGFYRMLGLDPGQLPEPDPEQQARLQKMQWPFALSSKGRFARLVCQAYQALVKEIWTYMEGHYYNDPEDPRCKRVTVNYRQVQELCSALKEKIEYANLYDTYSEVLQFARRLDVQKTEKESVAGGPVQLNLDQELAFTAPDIQDTGLPEYPEMPSLEQVKSQLKVYAHQVFAEAPQEIRSILEAVKKG